MHSVIASSAIVKTRLMTGSGFAPSISNRIQLSSGKGTKICLGHNMDNVSTILCNESYPIIFLYDSFKKSFHFASMTCCYYYYLHSCHSTLSHHDMMITSLTLTPSSSSSSAPPPPLCQSSLRQLRHLSK